MGAKTKIDWCDSTWNPVTGCLHGCAYCYADRMARRFGCHMKPETDYPVLDYPVRCTDTYDYMRAAGISAGSIQPYPYDFTPTFHKYRLKIPQDWKKPRNIFVCSMADLFGDWVPDGWIDDVIGSTQQAPQHRYLFLTKNPKRYDEWLERFEESKIPGLDEIQNCWFGASASNNQELERANRSRAIWLSIEPIREEIETDEDQFVDCHYTPAGEVETARWAWVVIGAETGNSKDKVKPKREWIDAIVEVCSFYNTPVYMKESLREIMGDDFLQEFPWHTGSGCNGDYCEL